METDLAYYRRRLAEEEAAATAASGTKAGRVHAELASRYAERVKALEAEPAPAMLHLTAGA